MNLGLVYSVVTGQFAAAVRAMQKPIATAATGAIKDLAQEIIDKGRSNIAAAGFSTRWQKGLVVVVTPKSGVAIDCEAHVFHRRGFATVFETGAMIGGKPLLWLPLPTLPDHIGGQMMTPRNFVRRIGPLFTLKAPGKPPMLGGYMQGLAGSKVTIANLRRGGQLAKLGVRSRPGAYGSRGVVLTPVFVGVSQVTLRKRWDLTGVYAQAEHNLAANYLRRINEANR
jgi:hypothetical protein